MAISSFRNSGLANTNTLFVPNANFSNTATGTYSNSGKNYKFVTFTGNETLVITTAGILDVLVVGGGGGASYYAYCGAQNVDAVCGGDGGSAASLTSLYVPLGSHTVTIGGGGTGNTNGNASSIGSFVIARGGVGGPSRGNRGGMGAGAPYSSKNGGSGVLSSITNTATYYGGGGGSGSGYNPYVGPGNGGAGGGGNGGSGTGGGVGSNGTANTGGGAGGAPWRFCDQGSGDSSGGSGIVIVRVEV